MINADLRSPGEMKLGVSGNICQLGSIDYFMFLGNFVAKGTQLLMVKSIHTFPSGLWNARNIK